jgi:hypothetical protein
VKSLFIGGELAKTILVAAFPAGRGRLQIEGRRRLDNSFYYPGYRKSNPLFRSRAAISALDFSGVAPADLIALALLNR